MSAEPLALHGFAPIRASLVELARRLILLTKSFGDCGLWLMLLGSTVAAIQEIDNAVDAFVAEYGTAIGIA